jgi:amidase
LTAMTGIDTDDAITKESTGKSADYTTFLDPNGLKGKRIGIEKKKYTNPLMAQLFQKAVDDMKKQGAEIVEIEYLAKIDANGEAETAVLQYEFKYSIHKYLATAHSPMKTLKDLIEFNKKNEDKAMPTFKQETFEKSEAKGDLTSKEYLAALEKSHNGSKKIIDTALQQHKLDAIAGLTMGPACSIDTIYGDRWGDVFLTAPAATSGYPHISVPCGKVYDLPVGLSFFSGAYTEGGLIALAFAYEQATKHRTLPEFKKAFLG